MSSKKGQQQEGSLTGEGEEVGDSRAEGSSRAAISLIPDIDGMHIGIFESSQLEDPYVGDLLHHALECVCHESESEVAQSRPRLRPHGL